MTGHETGMRESGLTDWVTTRLLYDSYRSSILGQKRVTAERRMANIGAGHLGARLLGLKHDTAISMV